MKYVGFLLTGGTSHIVMFPDLSQFITNFECWSPVSHYGRSYQWLFLLKMVFIFSTCSKLSQIFHENMEGIFDA